MMKAVGRRFLCILLLLMVTICFCACSSVAVMTITNDDGTIDELVTVTLDRNILAENGLAIDDVKEDIQISSINEATQIVYQYNTKLQEDMIVSSIETRQILASFVGGLDVVGNTWQDDVYVIGIRFKNIDVYRYYYNISEKTEVQTTTEEHFLYNKVSYQAYTMYASYGELYSKLSVYFLDRYPEFDLTHNELVYTYVSDSGRQHSDADFVIKQGGKYYHSWIVEDEQKIVTFYYNIANKTNWIVICLGVAILTAIVLGTVAIIKNKINKKS